MRRHKSPVRESPASFGKSIIRSIRYQDKGLGWNRIYLNGLKKERLDALRPSPAAASKRLNEQLIVEWVYNSNAIEGNTLTLRETQLILEQGITIGDKSLREHFEVINHQEAIEMVKSLVAKREPVTAFEVRPLHALVLSKIDDDNASQHRQISKCREKRGQALSIPKFCGKTGQAGGNAQKNERSFRCFCTIMNERP